MGISPITQGNFNYLTNKGIQKENILKEAVKEFLIKEIKYTEQEYQELDLVNITRPKLEGIDRLYLRFTTEKSANYLFRKTINITNKNGNLNKIKLTPFIPPQLYNRFNDLSRNTYQARQSNPDLKTLIKIGDEDLILLTKNKGDKEWTQQMDFEEFGQIAPPQWHRL